MILEELDFGKQADRSETQACLTICQAIHFNAKKHKRQGEQERHSKVREPPLPIYVGLSLHAQGRSRKLIEKFHKLWLSVSYDRVIELENQLACAISEHFEEDGAVCPVNLRKGLFTVCAIDNLDHNQSAIASKAFFHGTGISVFQIPTEENHGEERPSIRIPYNSPESRLSATYTNVPTIAFSKNGVEVNICNDSDSAPSTDDAQQKALVDEDHWIEDGSILLSKPVLDACDKLTWAADHASVQPVSLTSPCLRAILPLFYEKAATISMIKHGMDIVKTSTEFRNPGQIPVLAMDQPLYALAKQIQ